MPKFCPHCGAELDHLHFQQDITQYGYEYGDCETDGTDCNSDDSDINDTDYGDTQYTCPECDEELDPSDLFDHSINDDDEENDEDSENEDDNEDEDEDISSRIVQPRNSGIIVRSSTERSLDNLGHKICPNCGTVNIFEVNNNNDHDDDEDEAIICNKCNNEF